MLQLCSLLKCDVCYVVLYVGRGLKSTTQNIHKKVLLDTEVKAETDMRYKDKLAMRGRNTRAKYTGARLKTGAVNQGWGRQSQAG